MISMVIKNDYLFTGFNVSLELFFKIQSEFNVNDITNLDDDVYLELNGE